MANLNPDERELVNSILLDEATRIARRASRMFLERTDLEAALGALRISLDVSNHIISLAKKV